MQSLDELEHDHRVIEVVLHLLGEVAAHAGEGRAFEFGAWALEFFRRFADACHHAKEERALFPRLEERGIPRRGGPIGMMLVEHEEGRRLLGDLARALAERDHPLFVASAGAYVGLLRTHIAKERNVLFPLGARRLSTTDDRELVERFAEIERASGGEALHERFHAELGAWKERLGSLAVAPASPQALTAPHG